MHHLHGELLRRAGISSELSLFEPPETIYAAAWSDVYWAEALGGEFQHDHRLLRRGSEVAMASSDGSCRLFNVDNDPKMLGPGQDCGTYRQELVELFSQNNAGSLVTPSEETLERLKSLGYVGE